MTSDKKKTRVLFALPGLHRVNRGAEVAFESIATRIARMPGYEVTLIGSGQAREGDPYRFIHAGSLTREMFEDAPFMPFLRTHYAYEELSFMPSLFMKYSPGEYDVTVTCAYPYTNWLLRRGRHRPLHVYVTQNGDWPLKRSSVDSKPFGCDGLVCTNPEYYDRHHEKWPAALIPNGVDLERFGPGVSRRGEFGLIEGVPTVLIVIALIASKRVLEGIRAVSRIPNVQLVVAGDGELKGEVEALGRELLGNRFRRLTVARERMPDMYRSVDALVHMSKDEPFGNIYIEAMAVGLPVVAHDTRTTRWICDGNASLVDTEDFEAVAQALMSVMGQPDPVKARRRIELVNQRFGWDAVAKAYCDFFDKLALKGAGAT